MRYLPYEPNWETQDQVHLYLRHGMHYERFTGPNNEIYVAVHHETVKVISWYEFTKDFWNDSVDRAEETIGTNLYL